MAFIDRVQQLSGTAKAIVLMTLALCIGSLPSICAAEEKGSCLGTKVGDNWEVLLIQPGDTFERQINVFLECAGPDSGHVAGALVNQGIASGWWIWARKDGNKRPLYRWEFLPVTDASWKLAVEEGLSTSPNPCIVLLGFNVGTGDGYGMYLLREQSDRCVASSLSKGRRQ